MKVEKIREWLQDYIQTHSTQEAVAEKIGRPAATVSRWLTGTHPLSLENLSLLLQAAGVDLLTLIRIYSSSGVAPQKWQSVPLISIRRVPPMLQTFQEFIEAVEAVSSERVQLPIYEEPAVGIRISESREGFDAGEVLGVTEAKSLEPGARVLVQLQHRTDIGVFQKRGERVQVAVDGHFYDSTEYVLIGRIRGAWRDTP